MILSEKCLKLLRLALSSTHKGEADNAAIMFIAELKREGVTAEKFEAIPPRPGFVRVRRDSAASTPSRAQSAIPPIQTSPSPSPARKNNPYGAYEGEALQWVYENRHRLSKRARAAVEQEMENRGLI